MQYDGPMCENSDYHRSNVSRQLIWFKYPEWETIHKLEYFIYIYKKEEKEIQFCIKQTPI